MTIISFAPIANHLWQSTLFAVAAALLVAILRHNRPETKYRVWLAASIKFLVPFSVLAELGSRFAWKTAPVASTLIAGAVEQFGQPFTAESDPLLLGVAAAPAGLSAVPVAILALWLTGALVVLARWLSGWFGVRRAMRSAVPMDIAAPVRAFSVTNAVEPGVFGIFRPVLLLPSGIANVLTPAQLQAVLAHELSHVRRRDNLASAIHLCVEAIFWFHPLVWWIGARLVEERENACDEEVVRQGSAPDVYAEGILKVCRLYLESPLPCTLGVTGADLRSRIEAILTGRVSAGLGPVRKTLLIATAACALAGPLFVGALKAAQKPAAEPALTFDIASIRPSKSGETNSRLGPGPGGGMRAVNITPIQLITFAYKVRDFQIVDAPGWIKADRYDVLAKPERPEGPNDIQTMSDKQRMAHMEQMQMRLRGLLADRFQLAVRRDTRELPFYALVQAKGGSRMKPAEAGQFTPQHMRSGRSSLEAQRVTMFMITNSLSGHLDRTVVDETGLKGDFDFKLEWDPSGDGGGASLFSAIQEQLGLKLESRKGPVEVLVIEKISKPSEN